MKVGTLILALSNVSEPLLYHFKLLTALFHLSALSALFQCLGSSQVLKIKMKLVIRQIFLNSPYFKNSYEVLSFWLRDPIFFMDKALYVA